MKILFQRELSGTEVNRLQQKPFFTIKHILQPKLHMVNVHSKFVTKNSKTFFVALVLKQ